jgi:hypothetical protein
MHRPTLRTKQCLHLLAMPASRPHLGLTHGNLGIAKTASDRKDRTQASGSTEASLRQKRRERLKAVSDEALIDLDDFTLMLIAKRG